jgi:hypothetical protein
MNIPMGSPKKPKMPDPVAPKAEMIDLAAKDSSGASNFEAEIRNKRKKAQTSFAGETGGYGGNTKLG